MVNHNRRVAASLLAAVALLAQSTTITSAFVPPAAPTAIVPSSSSAAAASDVGVAPLFGSSSSDWDGDGPDRDDDDDDRRRRRRLIGPAATTGALMRKLASSARKKVLPVVVASSALLLPLVGNPGTADASAPVMAMPKADERDPALDAIENHQRRMQKVAQEELRSFTERARQVEATEGADARAEFEASYKAEKNRLAQEKLDSIDKLKNDLLDGGICPFIDIEGQRQMILVEKGVDLAEVAGTPFNLEKEFEKRDPKQTFGSRKAANREIVRCMVEDMRNRGIDPVEYFQAHQQRTSAILELPSAQAASMAAKYRENLDLYGQITVPKDGEVSAKERMARQQQQRGAGKKSTTKKEEAKRIKQAEKAKAAALKAEAKANAKAEKQRAKEEKQKAKAEALARKEAEKKAAEEGTTTSAADDDLEQPAAVEEEPAAEVAAVAETKKKKKERSPSLKIVPASAALVAVAGGGYALKLSRDRAAGEEAERQRQFRLLMGGQEDEEEEGATTGGLPPSAAAPPSLESVDADLSGAAGGITESEKKKGATDDDDDGTTAAAAPPKTKKKKKRGGFFGKKKNDRETDIHALVSGRGAKAPAFAALLSKILTYGAPGRFPEILAIPGGMPMDGEFSVEVATALLVEAQASADLSREDAAEIFANVVNCMLIDIVDLASTSLKEKNSKVTVEAIGIVVDFMNHASSLYESIAGGVVIVPVTYGGDLSKGKLEQMYSAYAVSAITNIGSVDDSFDDRVRLLQDVFQINEKKAEGLMMKAVQKNMMEMMKTGEGMEGLEEMMKGMGDMGDLGMPGMPGMDGMDGEEPSPEQLKEMLRALKELKDSGSIPESELAEVKKQFGEAFGSGIDDIMKEADKAGGEMSAQDMELLELMKSILD